MKVCRSCKAPVVKLYQVMQRPKGGHFVRPARPSASIGDCIACAGRLYASLAGPRKREPADPGAIPAPAGPNRS